jgi:hypothetical protein
VLFISYIKCSSNSGNPGYSIHILNTEYTYGTIVDTMDIIRMGRRGRHLNTLVKYIYKISRIHLHINNTHIDQLNKKVHFMELVDSSLSHKFTIIGSYSEAVLFTIFL